MVKGFQISGTTHKYDYNSLEFPSGGIPASDLANGSITMEKLAPAVAEDVASIDGLKSAIDYIVEGEQYETPIIGDYDGTKFVASTNRAYVYCPLENIKTISIASGFQFSPRVNNSGVGSAFSSLKGWTSDPYDISAETRAYLLVMVRKPDNSALSDNELVNVITFKSKLSVAGLSEDVATCESKADNVSNLVGLKWITGAYIFADGSEASASDRACTDFIPCKSNASVTYVAENNNANVYGIAFYDRSYKSVGGFKNNGTLGEPVTVTTPNNTAYLRLSTKTAILNESYFAFNGTKNSALFALSQKAYNPVVYVDGESGSDTTGDGRATKPYKTIQHCIDLGYERIGILVEHICSETITATTGTLHLFGAKKSWNSQYPNRVRAKINGNSTISTALTITGLKKVILEDLEIYGCTSDGCKLDGCSDVQIVNCSFHDNGDNGIVLDYTNGVIRHSVAYNNTRDGFNMNYYGDTQFFDCSGYNNGDDGISHHQGCTGLIDGGEWYGNTKGGVASPANGADVNIMNVYSHDNGYGIWGNADSGTEARTFHVWNSVLVNNTQYGISSLRNTAVLYNCKIEGNTAGQTSGNVTVL